MGEKNKKVLLTLFSIFMVSGFIWNDMVHHWCQCKLCPGEKTLIGHDLSMSTAYSVRTFRAFLTYPRHISVEIMDLRNNSFALRGHKGCFLGIRWTLSGLDPNMSTVRVCDCSTSSRPSALALSLFGLPLLRGNCVSPHWICGGSVYTCCEDSMALIFHTRL